MKHLLSRAASSFIAPALLITLLVSLSVAPLLAAVGLTSFEVAPGNNNGELVVTWTTETEVDTIAFRLKRATVQDANVATDVVTLPALGAGVGGGSYEHRDPNLTTGTRYYYWLYEVTSSGDVVLLTAPINGTPGQSGATVTPSSTPTNTSQPTATPTRPATATPTQSGQTGNAPATNTATPTNTPPPTNTPVVPNTPVPTSPPAAAAANLQAATDTPQPTNTPENPEQTAAATSATAAELQGSQPTPVTDEENAPAPEAGQGEPSDQGLVVPPAPTVQADGSAPTGLTSVETPTAQAVAEADTQATAGAADTQPTVVRPTATPRPSQSDGSSRTTGLLAVIGGGSLCAAALLALVAVFIWRRR